MARISDQEKRDLIRQLESMSINRFLHTIREVSDKRGIRLDRFVADAVARDMQAHLDAYGIRPVCPKCGGTHYKRNGKRGEVQRYICLDCGRAFTAFTGTILEKTNYTWDAWVEVVRGMLNGVSIGRTRQTLEDDYECVKIDKDTVWLMRMKVMYAIASLPSPTLSGVIQFDDTFLREDQKASRHLVNPLGKKSDIVRRPRYGYVPAELGVKGNEFATITTAIDGSGHCVCRVLGCGVVPAGVLYDFIRDNTKGMAFACSDGDGTYKRVFSSMNVAHYMRPSNYLKVVRAAGYAPAHGDKEREASNRYILERLWSEGAIDRILNRGKMTYERFISLKKANGLSIARVNGLHNELKECLERATRGVSTKYLPYYLAWFEFVHNRGVDVGHPLTSRKDAEGVLLAAVSARRSITTAEIAAIRNKPLAIPQASSRYLRLLEQNTAKMRVVLNDPAFMFGDEDNVASFNTRAIVYSLNEAKVRELAHRLRIDGWGSRSRSSLAEEIIRHPGVGDYLLVVAVDAEPRAVGATYDEGGNKVYRYHTHRSALPAMFSDLFCGFAGTNGRSLLFVDTETTGLDPSYDEVIQFAAVDCLGEVLYGDYLRPAHRKRWSEAAGTNHITPEMVAGRPTLADEHGKVEGLFHAADVVVGWNLMFDLRMLYANEVEVPTDRVMYLDLMPAFCEAWGKTHSGYHRKKREKLVNATRWLNIRHNAHDAIGDAAVLLPIWEWVASVLLDDDQTASQ